MFACVEGDVFDDTAISEELLDDNDDVLNVSILHATEFYRFHIKNIFFSLFVKDDELDEETKSYLISASAQDEDAILSSPKGSTSSKSPENPTESSPNASQAPASHKKVVLKRKLLQSVSLTESEAPKSSTESKIIKIGDISADSSDEKATESTSSNGNTDGNVVKLSQLTMKERLELRAKKFGAAASTGNAAKLARAERFGLAADTTASGTDSSSITQKTAPNVDLLKKRAERFGGSVSNAMVKIEQKEKLMKRQERFGDAPGSAKISISTQAADDYAEKAKQRLERFKTSA